MLDGQSWVIYVSIFYASIASRSETYGLRSIRAVWLLREPIVCFLCLLITLTEFTCEYLGNSMLFISVNALICIVSIRSKACFFEWNISKSSCVYSVQKSVEKLRSATERLLSALSSGSPGFSATTNPIISLSFVRSEVSSWHIQSNPGALPGFTSLRDVTISSVVNPWEESYATICVKYWITSSSPFK